MWVLLQPGPVDPASVWWAPLLQNGVMGLAVIALAYYVLRLERKMQDDRAEHAKQIAEKDKQIAELSESRVHDAQKVTGTLLGLQRESLDVTAETARALAGLASRVDELRADIRRP